MTDEMILLADCYEDCAMLTNDPFDLDPEISALADDAAQWLALATMTAHAMGLTPPQGIAAMLAHRSHIYTGYMPEPQRRNMRHRMYRDGLVTPPRRQTAADRKRAEAQRLGIAR